VEVVAPKFGYNDRMSESTSPRNLEKYLAAARKLLSEEKLRELEEVYLRMQERADRWKSPHITTPPEPNLKLPTQSNIRSAD